MASSQVEIATSSTFVHTRRDSCFQNNLDRSHIDFTDLWVHRPQNQTATSENDCDNINNDNRKADKWSKAREMVFSREQGSTKDANLGGGVSSLVEKWRGFEAKRSSTASSTNTMFQMDNISAAGVDPPCTPMPSPSPSLYEDVDSFMGDWEPEAAFSGPPCSRSQDSNAIEIERLRVADIIKRISSSSQSDQQQCHSPIVNTSPCIRGRQAFNDLLMQLYRERHKELEGIAARKPVSKFCHRGRIKALLRFRFLRHGMEAKQDRHSNVNSSHIHKTIRHPGVMHNRERVKPSAQEGPVSSGCCHKELVNNTSTVKNVFVANQYNEVTDSERCSEKKTDITHESEGPLTSKQHDDVGQSSHKGKEDTETNVHLCHSYGKIGHEANPFSKLIRKEDDSEDNNHKQLAKSVGNDGPLHSAGIDLRDKFSPHTIETTGVHNKEEADSNHHQLTINNCEEELPSYHKDEPTQDLVDTDSMYWVSDIVSNPDVEWDELQSDNRMEEQEGSNTEWIYQVARPRSDWEGLRQERYQEMLDPSLDNEEIRQLLGRRSVSTFLSSSMRDKIDQVMASRAQGQQTLKTDETRVKEKHEIRLRVKVGASDEQDKCEDYNNIINFDEYEEADESSVGQQYNNDEPDDYTDQITRTSSWPQNQESSDYSYNHHIASPSTTQQSPSNYYNQTSSRRPNSSHSSAIDMELIYDLRGHMEQLHQEMSELRKSIKCCVDMQINLQHSIKKEVATAIHEGYSEAKGRQNSVKKVTSTTGGSTIEICCVCCKMQVDSLLYRCGHMCTCFECAHKLHWSSGKCPICRAPILDVVRTYSNHS